MAASDHPTAERLATYCHGRLADAEAAAVERHLRGCAACRELVDQSPPDSLLRQVREAKPNRGTVVAGAVPAMPAAQAAAVSQPQAIRVADIPPELAGHDRYEVVQLLGRGGMGTVYLAEQGLMRRKAVLKMIHPQLLARDELRQRFEQEVVAVGKLNHPNVVQAYEAFRAGDAMVLAMEYVDGIDLAAYVARKGPLEVPLACRWVQQAAQGLQAAHKHGLVHRDVKPHNLMISREGQVKVLDFGLAQLAGGGGGLTQDGVLMGTPEYMAPEQWDDPGKVDIRADLYSLGCTLFFLLTGRPPFPGPGARALLHQHSDVAPPSLREKCPAAPEGLEQVYQKLMAKAPADRYASPKELAQGLTPFVKGAAVPPLPAAPPAPPAGGTHAGGGSETRPPLAAPVAPALPPRVAAPPARPPRPSRRTRPVAVWGVAAVVAALFVGVAAVLVLTLQTSDGTLVVRINEPGAKVEVDTALAVVKYTSDGRVATVTARKGELTLTVSKAGRKSVRKSVQLTGRTSPVEVELIPDAPPPRPDGTLVVRVNEPDAVVKVDSPRAAVLPRGADGKETRVTVAAGTVRLTVSKPGWATVKREAVVQAGGTTTVQVELVKEPAVAGSDGSPLGQGAATPSAVPKPEKEPERMGLPAKESDPAERNKPERPIRVVSSTLGPRKSDTDGWFTLNHDGSTNATTRVEVHTDGSTFWLNAKDSHDGKEWGWHAPPSFAGTTQTSSAATSSTPCGLPAVIARFSQASGTSVYKERA